MLHSIFTTTNILSFLVFVLHRKHLYVYEFQDTKQDVSLLRSVDQMT